MRARALASALARLCACAQHFPNFARTNGRARVRACLQGAEVGGGVCAYGGVCACACACACARLRRRVRARVCVCVRAQSLFPVFVPTNLGLRVLRACGRACVIALCVRALCVRAQNFPTSVRTNGGVRATARARVRLRACVRAPAGAALPRLRAHRPGLARGACARTCALGRVRAQLFSVFVHSNLGLLVVRACVRACVRARAGVRAQLFSVFVHTNLGTLLALGFPDTRDYYRR